MKLSKVNCSRGAPMGRHSTHAADTAESRKFYLARVSIDSGGYDNGGAYWGLGDPLYRAYSDMPAPARVEFFFRARTRDDAKASVTREYPNASFFR